MLARTKKTGFTLVEILIVVIILGILAAIVIPQFTNASNDARQSSLASQLQTVRGQVELYKLQHTDQWPTDNKLITGTILWSMLTGTSNPDGTTPGNLGPYLQQAPTNPLSPTATNTVITTVNTEPAVGDVHLGSAYIFSSLTGKIYGTDKDGKVTAD